MIHVRYATGWRYDASQAVVRIGSLVVPVSSPRIERFGSWWLRRLDADTWKVFAHRFGTEGPCPIYAGWGLASVVLLGAPDDVSLELELA